MDRVGRIKSAPLFNYTSWSYLLFFCPAGPGADMRIGVICVLVLLPVVHFRVVVSSTLKQYGLGNAPLTHWLRQRNSENDLARKKLEKALRQVESALKQSNCKKDKPGAPYSVFGQAVYADADWIRYASTGARALGLKINNTACSREYASPSFSQNFHRLDLSLGFGIGKSFFIAA